MKIKDWKIDEVARNNNGGFLVSVDGVERETEKAYLLCLTWGYSSNLEKRINIWCPKSATMTDEEFENDKEAYAKRCDDGLAYNKSLVDFAKANGIKGVRAGLKTATLLNKIALAGLTAPVRA